MNPEYFNAPSLYCPYIPKSVVAIALDDARPIRLSSTTNCVVATVVVVPLTVKLPAIVTLSGSPTVTEPVDPLTVISFAVPVRSLTKLTASTYALIDSAVASAVFETPVAKASSSMIEDME